eukprot:scaffold2979_cov405-Prasinococcus_capsulatus_cf.AAC.4
MPHSTLLAITQWTGPSSLVLLGGISLTGYANARSSQQQLAFAERERWAPAAPVIPSPPRGGAPRAQLAVGPPSRPTACRRAEALSSGPPTVSVGWQPRGDAGRLSTSQAREQAHGACTLTKSSTELKTAGVPPL